MNLENLIRENVKKLSPYSSARDEFEQFTKQMIYLDANENPFTNGMNRYPDSQQKELKAIIGDKNNVSKENILLGNGSDEVLDLIFRAFCEPNQDNVIAISPSYGMYGVLANLNAIEYRKSLLNEEDFQPNIEDIFSKVDDKTKMIFLCSPNNPTGEIIKRGTILEIVNRFNGLVIIDEAYIDFSERESYIKYLKEFPNLVILQTFSKAWANAGVRLGMAFASEEIIAVLNKIKYPYNINILTQEHIQKALKKNNVAQVQEWIRQIKEQRAVLMEELKSLPMVLEVYPSDANFILAKMDGAIHVYNILVKKSIIVRDRSKVSLCDDCLRITVGTPEENQALMSELRKLRY